MNSTIDPSNFVTVIKRLSSQAIATLPVTSLAHEEARIRAHKPIDYMRCAEFPLAVEHLNLAPGMKVLDVSSPQWFSLYLASLYPETKFYYVNILDNELEQIRETAKHLNIRNLSYYRQDVRSLEFNSCFFDRAISISVIEHIAPEVGGDLQALNEIGRVLIPAGEITITVPMKDKANVVYQEGPVYERQANERNFFAREYDFPQFEKLVYDAAFLIKTKSFIIEKPGLFAIDYWEWGPGKDKIYRNLILKLRNIIEKVAGASIEDKIAVRYLKSSLEIDYRVVNIVAVLRKQ